MQNLKPTNTLNGCSGDDNVRYEFTKHYTSLFYPNTPDADDSHKMKTLDLLEEASAESTLPMLDIQILYNCICSLKNNKASGYDGICSEHIKHGGNHLLFHLCL